MQEGDPSEVGAGRETRSSPWRSFSSSPEKGRSIAGDDSPAAWRWLGRRYLACLELSGALAGLMGVGGKNPRRDRRLGARALAAGGCLLQRRADLRRSSNSPWWLPRERRGAVQMLMLDGAIWEQPNGGVLPSFFLPLLPVKLAFYKARRR
jgi:hypothetical protein